MHVETLTICDAWTAATSAAPAYSREESSIVLGRADSLALFVYLDHPDAAGGALRVFVEHGSDGRVWSSKFASPVIVGIIATTLPQSWVWADPMNLPSLAHVRVKLYFDAPTLGGRVRIQATLRDKH